MDFAHTTDARLSTRLYVPCATYNSSSFTFSGLLYPGTYKVTVDKLGVGNLPEWTAQVHAAFTVSGPLTNVLFNVPVPSEHPVSGSIKRNGLTPTTSGCDYNGQYFAAKLIFDELSDSRYSRILYVPCTGYTSSNFTFSGLLYPGTYKVTVDKLGKGNLPDWTAEVHAAFTVSAPASGLLFNVPVPTEYEVSGAIKRNGLTPTTTGCDYYDQYYAAKITFDELTDSRYSKTLYVPCASYNSSNFTFSGLLYPGTYEVTVDKLGQGNLPDWSTVVVGRLKIP